MKNNNRFFLTTLLFGFFLLTASANDTSGFSVQVFNNTTVMLDIENVQQGHIQILLQDEAGVILHKETLKRSSVHNRKYQLKNLPFGKYTFIAEYDGLIKFQPIKKGREILEIDISELRTIFKPTFQHNLDRLDLNMLCTDEFDISLQIRDIDYHNLYSEQLTFVGSLHKRYKLLELEDGSYFFTITIKEGSFKYEFNETFVISSLVDAN